MGIFDDDTALDIMAGHPDSRFSATGGEPITWAVESGALPPGLSLNTGTGLFSGIPTEAGEFSFYIVARNDYGESIRNFSIRVVAPPPGSPFIQTESLADAVVGYSYFQTLQATGDSPMVWTIHNGFLPPGLSLHATAGTISGTPTTSGRFTFTLRVANVPGAHMRTFTISVYNPPDTPPLY